MIEINKFTFKYQNGNKTAVNDINLKIEDDGFIRIHKDSRIYDLVKDAVKLNDEDLDLVHSFIKKMM